MSALVQETMPEYLYRTRIETGIPNRELAERVVHQSATQIGRHERGEAAVNPDDAVMYADGYDREDILIAYCAECPVGKRLRLPPGDWGLQGSHMRLSHLIKGAESVIAEMEAIVFDGIIDREEKPRHDRGIAYIRQIVQAAEELILAAYLEQKKDRPAPTGTATHQKRQCYCTSLDWLCQERPGMEARS